MSAPADLEYPIGDPRTLPETQSAPAFAGRLYALAEASLTARTAQFADAFDRELRSQISDCLAADAASLAAAVSAAPTVALARCLWRAIDAVWSEGAAAPDAALALTLFAVPVVIVTGLESAQGEGALSGTLADPAKLAAILEEFGALAGNRTIALANALVTSEAIDIARLPEIRAWGRLPDLAIPESSSAAPALGPAPISVHAGREAVHLRFLVGTAIARPDADLLRDGTVGSWGTPLARELARQLGSFGVRVLALPRTPQRPLPAVRQGRIAQREVSAQIFASNAIRRFRSTVGEPAAVISAHRTSEATAGGELRLSLSSPLEPRGAEGFRCPLYPLDRVGEVVSMLVVLMRDCRVADIRVLAGVHEDRVAGTGLPLLFKPETIPDAVAVSVR